METSEVEVEVEVVTDPSTNITLTSASFSSGIKISDIINSSDNSTRDKEQQLTSVQLYQMALPYIIQSNQRVQQMISKNRQNNRKKLADKLMNYLSKNPKRAVVWNSLRDRIESNGGAFERFKRLQSDHVKGNFEMGLKESLKNRKRISLIGAKIEKLTGEMHSLSTKTTTSTSASASTKAKDSNGKKKSKKTTTTTTAASTSGTGEKEGGVSSPRKKKSSTSTSQTSTSATNSTTDVTSKTEDEAQFSAKLIGLPEEEAHVLLWKHISRKQIPKLSRLVQQSTAARIFNAKKLAQTAAVLIKRQSNKQNSKPTVSGRKAMREMLMFWKRNEREERELRKKAEKEAVEKRRLEEEQREARRQAKKLNFLITQTELYSHFVGRKQQSAPQQQQQQQQNSPAFTKDMDFADIDDSVIHEEAARIAKNAAVAHQAKMEQFHGPDHKQEGADMDEKDNEKDMDFMNPSTLKDATILEQPSLMQVSLKSYQLKGLTWLASLYEQGINGILADEMGLGKTIQSISLLAHLAERQNNWGPFLIVTPASTLHNWQQEFARFVPALRIIPYWGNVQDRKVLRSSCMPFWTGKKAVTRDTPFHVMITSYQLIVSDEAYLQKVKWQYMILDEAQAIKSSASIRWKTLLGFKCRNRLLLTGTPIQNSMQELWALLHFIMPTLFDSHDEFSEWFSKDIENHAENRGSGLNSHQVHRLHMILKPFMLRRIKKDVENEMGEKVEKDVICELSPRQRRLYRGIKDKLPILELLSSATSSTQTSVAQKFNFGFGIGGAGGAGSGSSIDSALMNLVMQFRKVCNHPELLERTEISSPLTFTTPDRLNPQPSNVITSQFLYPHPSAITIKLPKRVINEIPIGKERILLEISGELDDISSTAGKRMKLTTSSSKLDICKSSEFKCSESFEFLSNRFQHAAPIKVLSRGSAESSDTDTQMTLCDTELSDLLPNVSKSVSIPSMEKFIRDCGKLSRLDGLLEELKSGGHRVLIYNQMTKMIDLLEEYLQWKGYSYLRLDGSTNIATRRDLVHSWQTDPSIFIFLLSTRAGGLGINLTAADTVIFYDSDWNPTVDQQAMDRAHRLGQTKQVTVYRMITRNTIEERIMQRAKQKDQIHKVVIAGGAFKEGIPTAASSSTANTDVFDEGKPKDRKEIMSLLLLDEE